MYIASKKQKKAIAALAVVGLLIWGTLELNDSYVAEMNRQSQQRSDIDASEQLQAKIKTQLKEVRGYLNNLDRINRESGHVEITEEKNSFGDTVNDIRYIQSIEKDGSDLMYVWNVEKQRATIQLSRPDGESFTNVIFMKSVDVQFDGVTKQYKFYPCKSSRLCVGVSIDFIEDLKKSSTLRIAIPYDSGTRIVDYNTTDIAKVINEKE